VLIATLFLVPVATAEAPASPTTGTKPLLVCGAGSTLASGRPDRSLFSAAASKGIRAHWCERYDAQGRTTRTGPYWEVYPNGRPRTQALYVGSRLSGPVTIRNDDGSLFLRGFLEKGEWSGELEIYHENGEVWLEARFDAGRLDGPVRTHYPDGALESESRYQNGREDGLARSFYSTALGGRLKSEAHLEADDFVGRHRILSRRGELVRSIDWSAGPAAWRARAADTVPAAPRPGPASAQRPRPSVSPPSDTRD
jgi:antitoxin component YwqK of YwqJK toxin-antitoxin module